MTQLITKQQLDALEAAADKVFGKLGIDVEFTRHFLDRVNDERNRKQITIRELGLLFAKEYKRWGQRIGKMPVGAEAVMKDLSSEINIPFVLNKDGKEKDLVAKTVMRKKKFHSPDPELPVESVNEDEEQFYVAGKSPFYKRMHYLNTDHPGAHIIKSHIKHATAMDRATAEKIAKQWEGHANRYKIELIPVNGVTEEKHGAKKGTQVKGKDATPKMTKPSTSGSQPHPMRGKLVGESVDTESMFSDVSDAQLISMMNAGLGKQREHAKIEWERRKAVGDKWRRDDGHVGFGEAAIEAAWESYQVDEKIVDPREAILMKALKYLDHKIKQGGKRQSIGGYAFDVGREINLNSVGINAKELAQLYRDWRGDSVVAEGWMEHNLYYLDEVINKEEHSESKGRKQVSEKKSGERKTAKK